MATKFEIDDGLIAKQNRKTSDWVEEDYEHLSKMLRRRNVDTELLVALAQSFRVAVPSWEWAPGEHVSPAFQGWVSRARSTRSWKTAARSSNSCARPCRFATYSLGQA